MKRLLAILLAIGVLICVTGCGGDDKDKKYDVTIKIVSDCGDIYFFPPDKNEMHVEIPYDGRERRFYVDSYQFQNYPDFGDTWLAPNTAYSFYSDLLYGDGYNWEESKTVLERGRYIYSFRTADYAAAAWNPRSIKLYIDVT